MTEFDDAVARGEAMARQGTLNVDEALVAELLTPEVVVGAIVTAWDRDTNWDEFGKEVAVILQTAGLIGTSRRLLPGAEALLTAPPIEGPSGPGDVTSLGR